MWSEGVLMLLYLKSAVASSPPAQPMQSSSSSSESRLIRMSPFSTPGFRQPAPVIPVSSSYVTRPSTGPCLMSLDCAIYPVPTEPCEVHNVLFGGDPLF